MCLSGGINLTKRVPSLVGAVLRTDGRGMINLGSHYNRSRHPTPDHIGKLPVDGWYQETRTAYQSHGCFFHGCPCTEVEINTVNKKPMTQLLTETRKNSAYLRRIVKVSEVWECAWKETRQEHTVKIFLEAELPGRRGFKRELPQQQILTAVGADTFSVRSSATFAFRWNYA